MHNGCTNRIDHGFFLMPILIKEYIKRGSLLHLHGIVHLNSSSLHVITLVKQDYKDPLAYQGKLLTLHCFVTNN